jgi:pyruvate carboxylase
VSAYLDGDRIIEIAKKEGCQAIHPGYGFVSLPCIVRFGRMNTYRNRDD